MPHMNIKELRLSKADWNTLKNRLYNHREIILQAVLCICILLLGIYRLEELQQPMIFHDEYGYWAGSAYLTGHDWSSVTSITPYYSYGYGILLIPIRLFFNSYSAMYQAACFLNGLMLVGSFILAIQISKRFLHNLSWLSRSMVCFAAIAYSSNIAFSHIAWSEITLTFVFWLAVFMLMKLVDRPTTGNHIGFAVVVFYLYVVHQRTLAVLIASVIIVLFMFQYHWNRVKQVGAFFLTLAAGALVHSGIKGGLQHDFYLNLGPSTFQDTLSYVINSKNMLLLLLIAGVLLLCYLLEKGYKRQVAWLAGLAVVAGIFAVGYLLNKPMSAGQAEARLSNNDFSGQWDKVMGLLNWQGVFRIFFSVTGKWFYLAASTGLVICWAMKDLISIFFKCCADLIKKSAVHITQYKYEANTALTADMGESIWQMFIFLACAGTFMISVIYKSGVFRINDLLYGRYNEFMIGILIIVGVNSLLGDRKWIRTLAISLLLFIGAAFLCQYILDGLGNTDYEICHSVNMSTTFKNKMYFKGAVFDFMWRGMLLGLGFIMMIKVKLFQKYLPYKIALACLIPLLAWNHVAYHVVDTYVITRNRKQSNTMPPIVTYIDLIDVEANVYYLRDTASKSWAESFQFMLPEYEVTMIESGMVDFQEDAFYISGNSFARNSEEVKEKCTIVYQSELFTLMVPKGKAIDAVAQTIG